MKDLIEDWIAYYDRYWSEVWARARPYMCKYCTHRLECLTDEEINTSHCTEAWNKMAHEEGPYNYL